MGYLDLFIILIIYDALKIIFTIFLNVWFKNKPLMNKEQQQQEDDIDFSDYPQMAKDCWLFLTNDKMPYKAEIKQEAFLHEVEVMIECAASYAGQNSNQDSVKEDWKEKAKKEIYRILFTDRSKQFSEVTGKIISWIDNNKHLIK